MQHIHVSALAFLYIGFMALLFIQLARLVAAELASKQGFIGEMGKALAFQAA